ncbi:hypothetical protein C7M84_016256 [Penaeus vannamei]|uniref:RNA-directed DNA polymerase n=1 Tax=Penaeus vannamei TaxID=6689 RepID=A0A3R7LXD1_PENVA|nr:hypothetical protein C7M84_016256 [Penaeus vannamei]
MTYFTKGILASSLPLAVREKVWRSCESVSIYALPGEFAKSVKEKSPTAAVHAGVVTQNEHTHKYDIQQDTRPTQQTGLNPQPPIHNTTPGPVQRHNNQHATTHYNTQRPITNRQHTLHRQYTAPRPSSSKPAITRWLPSPEQCFNCTRYGHIAADCTFPSSCPYHHTVARHNWANCKSFPEQSPSRLEEAYLYLTSNSPISQSANSTCLLPPPSAQHHIALPRDPHGRRARAIEVLAEYDVTIVYLPGRQNVVADALSRAPLPSPAELQACKSTPFPPSFAKRHEARTTAPVLANVANQPVDPPSEEEIRRAQREDPVYMDIIGKLERGEPLVPVRRLPVRQFYLADSGLLFRRATPKKIKGRRGLVRDVVVIPESLEPRVLQLVHESREAAHCGVYKAIQMARQRFFFPLLITKVKKHVKSCKVCPYFKGSTNQPAPALRYDVPDFPFEKVSCDTLSGFVTTRSGNKHILVFVDNFTRYCELVPVPNKSAKVVAKAFHDFIQRYTTPTYFSCDNGTEFQNEVMDNLYQSNGITERLNGSILTFMRSLVDTTSDNWDDLLLTIQSAINSTFHSSLGDTPHFLLYGSDKRLPYDLFQTRRKPEYSDSVGALVFRKVHTSDSMRPKLALALTMLVLMLLAMASPLLAEPGLPERLRAVPASKGTVSESLISPQDIDLILKQAASHKLHPLFTLTDRVPFYSTLKSFLTISGHTITTPPPTFMTACTQALPRLFVCNSRPLPLFSDDCSDAIITNHNIINECSFDSIVPTSRPFLLPFDDISVLYFFQPSTATVTCKEALPDVVVTGIYVLPISCEIVTTSLFIPASHSYATDISVRGLNISPMPGTGCARFRSTYHHSDTCQKSRASQPVNPDAPTPGRHLATAAA